MNFYETNRLTEREQTCGHQGGGWGRDGVGVWG